MSKSFSFVRKMTDPGSVQLISGQDIYKRIISDEFRPAVQSIRRSIANQLPKKEIQKLKLESLSSFYGATFKGKAHTKFLLDVTYVILDFDDSDTYGGELKTLLKRCNADRHTLMSFISPSGKGVKVIVPLPEVVTNLDHYYLYWKRIVDYYEDLTGDTADPVCKNATRGCYFSYDKDAYFNQDAHPINKINKPTKIRTTIPRIKYKDNVDELIDALDYLFDQHIDSGEWTKIGFALTAVENGKEYFISKSLSNPYYNDTLPELEAKWANLVLTARGSISVGTIYYYAQQKGKQNGNYTLPPCIARQRIVDMIDVTTGLIIPIDVTKYWECTIDAKGKKKVIIKPALFLDFMDEQGFRVVTIVNVDLAIYARIQNKVVSEITLAKMQSHFTLFIEGMPSEIGSVIIRTNSGEEKKIPFFRKEIKDAVMKLKLFTQSYMGHLIPISLALRRDSRDHGYFYFRNCFLDITKSGYTIKSYKHLEGYLWKSQVIDRHFELPSKDVINKEIDESHFCRFIANVTNHDPLRFLAMKSTIGYMLHTYKNMATAKAVIFMDENISSRGSIANGGTGKSLIGLAIGKIRSSYSPDGKNFSFKSDFAFQLVKPYTEVFNYNDATQNFEFQDLFSAITDAITINLKNKQAYTIPFHASPKFMVSTNYTVKGTGSSYDRRKYEIELAHHYTDTHTPEDEFGTLFFSEWDDTEWTRFFFFMMDCLRTYLNEGLIVAPSKNMQKNKSISGSNEEFNSYMEGYLEEEGEEVVIYLPELYTDFILEHPDQDFIKAGTIKKYLHTWLTERQLPFKTVQRNYHINDGGIIILKKRATLIVVKNLFAFENI